MERDGDIHGKLRYLSDIETHQPDFLSGTRYKTKRYDATAYYESVFGHFKENLERSPVLVVIGYGFGDCEINRYINRHLPQPAQRCFPCVTPMLTELTARLKTVRTGGLALEPDVRRSLRTAGGRGRD